MQANLDDNSKIYLTIIKPSVSSLRAQPKLHETIPIRNSQMHICIKQKKFYKELLKKKSNLKNP